MSIVKEKVQTIINDMTETDTWDDLMYKIEVVQKIEKALESEAQGKMIPHEEVKREILGRFK
jgi:hypothetical protein